jgi:hypothetical protein
MFYVMTASEAVFIGFFEGLSKTRPGLMNIAVERGFQRDEAADRRGAARELFGFQDGLRNVPWRDRYRVVFVNRDEAPNEPPWTEDGTYMAYLKIRQDLDRWEAMPVEEQERIMGRRRSDGSRIDLDPGTDPREEGAFVGDRVAPTAHVRKAREESDEIRIFRRGVPFLGLNPDGTREGGLQFVSFQADLENFDTVLQRWMLNPDFPQAGSGIDRLFGEGLVSVQRSGFFFVPPFHPDYIGAGVFEEAPPEPRPRDQGRLIVRKRAFDQAGAPAMVNLAGVWFQVFRAGTDEAIGDRFKTNPAGHTISPDLPVRTPLTLREVETLPSLEPSGPIDFTLERRRDVVEVSNRVRQPGTY